VGSASKPGEYDSIPDEGCGTCCLFDSDVAVLFQVVPEGSALFHQQRPETIGVLLLILH